MIKCSYFFFCYVIKQFVNKRIVGAVSCVNVMHSNTINEPYTFEQELTICLFRFVDFYLLIFPVIYLKQHLSRGVHAGRQLYAVYLCHQR